MKPNVLFDSIVSFENARVSTEHMIQLSISIDLGMTWETTTEGNRWGNLRDVLHWVRDPDMYEGDNFKKMMAGCLGSEFPERMMVAMKKPITTPLYTRQTELLKTFPSLLNAFNWQAAPLGEKFWETVYYRMMGYYCYGADPALQDRIHNHGGPPIVADELLDMAFEYERHADFFRPALRNGRNMHRRAGVLI